MLRPLLLGVAALIGTSKISPEEQLLTGLRALAPRRPSWSSYQKLISRILERLFYPPSSTPIVNHAEELDVNRRDIILPNYADSGFWLFVRER